MVVCVCVCVCVCLADPWIDPGLIMLRSRADRGPDPGQIPANQIRRSIPPGGSTSNKPAGTEAIHHYCYHYCHVMTVMIAVMMTVMMNIIMNDDSNDNN